MKLFVYLSSIYTFVHLQSISVLFPLASVNTFTCCEPSVLFIPVFYNKRHNQESIESLLSAPFSDTVSYVNSVTLWFRPASRAILNCQKTQIRKNA